MNMNGMYHEDAENQNLLNATVNRDQLKEEADVVLQGDADNPNQDYEVVKPEGGYKEVTRVANPYQFASQNDDVKVLVLHGDGSFDRYNFAINAKPATQAEEDDPADNAGEDTE